MNLKNGKSSKIIAVAGCKHTTKDLILGLKQENIDIQHCITISPEKGKSQKVAGYMDISEFLASQSISCTVADKYTLKSEKDKESILKLNIDLLLVMGWQRLIPDWLLNSLSIGAFGMHGSSKRLPYGRGRSPLNWSLIQNKTTFYTHLFQYKPGVDDGPVVGVQVFDINPYDTSLTVHFKNTIAMKKLCVKYVPDLLNGTATLSPQLEEEATYYPKRNDEDGAIYWHDSTTDIYNLIRAVTKPFPGAFSYLDNDPDSKVYVWRAIPFDNHLEWPESKTGEILEVFFDGSFVVKTGDSTLLVLENEGHQFSEGDVGRRFGNLNNSRKIWENIPL